MELKDILEEGGVDIINSAVVGATYDFPRDLPDTPTKEFIAKVVSNNPNFGKKPARGEACLIVGLNHAFLVFQAETGRIFYKLLTEAI